MILEAQTMMMMMVMIFVKTRLMERLAEGKCGWLV
jgi:hypothetical protein